MSIPKTIRSGVTKKGSFEKSVDLISYWLGTHETQDDEHLIPIVDIKFCAPCHASCGNFETIELDAVVLVQKYSL